MHRTTLAELTRFCQRCCCFVPVFSVVFARGFVKQLETPRFNGFDHFDFEDATCFINWWHFTWIQ